MVDENDWYYKEWLKRKDFIHFNVEGKVIGRNFLSIGDLGFLTSKLPDDILFPANQRFGKIVNHHFNVKIEGSVKAALHCLKNIDQIKSANMELFRVTAWCSVCQSINELTYDGGIYDTELFCSNCRNLIPTPEHLIPRKKLSYCERFKQFFCRRKSKDY